jgi:hypothetical protein
MEKTLHVFDMDDSLLETPTMADFVGVENGGYIDSSVYFPEYFTKVKSAFWDVLSKEVNFMRMHDYVVPINTATGKYFDEDSIKYFTDNKHKRMFEIKNGVLVISSFPGFHSDPNTIGAVKNDPVVKDYMNAENKMVLTGRDTGLRDVIFKRFEELGIEEPNYGLVTYKSGRLSIGQFKVQAICQSIKEFGWDTVHFYEDRKDWLESAMAAVAELFPGVTFYPHLITNVKDKRKIH